MILSKTPAKIKQVNALSKARSWRGNFVLVKRAVLEAAAAYPISEIQWYNLARHLESSSEVAQLRTLVEGARHEH